MRCRPSEDVCLEHSRLLVGERFCADGCKHERRAQHNEPCSVRGPRVLVKSLRCLDCGAWLSLGPSRDDGEHAAQVAVEVRAAELAWGKRRDFSADEWHGWDKHLFDGSPVENPEHQSLSLRGWVASRHAGYLARAIATHTEET